MPILVLVLGMHRSGTSALTGALSLAGAPIPKSLMPSDAANDRGYFESSVFMEFHDSILNSAGTNWRDWRAFPESWRYGADASSFRSQAGKLLQDEFGAAALIALKDPRMCRFVPFWLDAAREARFSPRVIVPFRSPGEVALSLAARDGFFEGEGVLLWLRHVLDAERNTRGLARAFVSFDSLLADPASAVQEAGRKLHIRWPSLDADAVNQFVSPDMKHQTRPDPKDVGAWAAQAFDALGILVEGPQSMEAAQLLDDVATQFEEACLLFNNLANPATKISKQKLEFPG